MSDSHETKQSKLSRAHPRRVTDFDTVLNFSFSPGESDDHWRVVPHFSPKTFAVAADYQEEAGNIQKHLQQGQESFHAAVMRIQSDIGRDPFNQDALLDVASDLAASTHLLLRCAKATAEVNNRSKRDRHLLRLYSSAREELEQNYNEVIQQCLDSEVSLQRGIEEAREDLFVVLQ
jgi:Skp family chaperone for outer membrane proteins